MLCTTTTIATITTIVTIIIAITIIMMMMMNIYISIIGSPGCRWRLLFVCVLFFLLDRAGWLIDGMDWLTHFLLDHQHQHYHLQLLLLLEMAISTHALDDTHIFTTSIFPGESCSFSFLFFFGSLLASLSLLSLVLLFFLLSVALS